MVTICFDNEFPVFSSCHTISLLQVSPARELFSSDGKGRENNYCQLLHESGNHVRVRFWRPGWENTAKSRHRSVALSIWVLVFMSHTAFRESHFQRIMRTCPAWFGPCCIYFCWLIFATEFFCVLSSLQQLSMIYVTPRSPMKRNFLYEPWKQEG